MREVSQNPRLGFIGGGLCVLSVVGALTMDSGLAAFMGIAGLLLANTGTDTKLTEDGIKLGFTKLKASEIAEFYEGSEGELVLVKVNRRRLRLKRWHYAEGEWNRIHEHLSKLLTDGKTPGSRAAACSREAA